MIKKKIKGNSILEVLIALVIMTASTCSAIMICENIQRSNSSFFRLKAIGIAEDVFKKELIDGIAQDKIFSAEGFKVQKKAFRHQLLNDCYVIDLKIFDATGKLLEELQLTKREEK